MKIFKRICLLTAFGVFAIITISQISRKAMAGTPISSPVVDNTPITSSVTPTPTPDDQDSPITSAVTPTATPTQTPTPTQAPSNDNQGSTNSNNSNSGSNNSSNNNSGSHGPSQCNSTKPAATFITSIAPAPKNGVTVSWSKVRENVTYYLIAYSRTPGVIEYATGHISSDTNRFTIYGLGRQTYYFKVRAGNGCMPGDFSAEVGIKNGRMVYVPVYNSKQSVLGTSQKVQNSKINKIGAPKNQPIQTHEQKPIKPNNPPQKEKNVSPTGIWGFFGKLFGGK